MFRRFNLYDEIELRNGATGINAFVVYAGTQRAAEITARIHLTLIARALGLA